MEKSFVDLYLVDEWSALASQYLSKPHTIQLLNPFEKCLLIEVLIAQGHPALAKKMATQMREQCQGGSHDGDRDYVNKIFDLILNLNSTSKQEQMLNQFGQDIIRTTQNRQAMQNRSNRV